MDFAFQSKPLTIYFQEIIQDFLPNKKLSFKLIKKKNSNPYYSFKYEGGIKSSNNQAKSMINSKEIKLRQTLDIGSLLTLSMNFQPYKSNGLEISVKKKLDPFKMQLSMLLLNELSKKINLTKLSLCYNQKPHKLSLKYLASKNPFPVFELDYFGTVKIEPFKNIDFGFSCNFNERHSYNLNYYELFLKGSIQSYQILGALTSNKGGIGQKKLSPGILTLAFKKDYRGKVLNMVLEHHLQEKTSLLSACYESNIEEAIILKNMVDSDYQVSSSLIYKVNQFLKIMHTTSINIKRFFNQGEKYKLGLGFFFEI